MQRRLLTGILFLILIAPFAKAEDPDEAQARKDASTVEALPGTSRPILDLGDPDDDQWLHHDPTDKPELSEERLLGTCSAEHFEITETQEKNGHPFISSLVEILRRVSLLSYLR